MKIRAAITALILGLICGPALWAQGAPAQKVGVIMYFRALVECAEGKVANDEFQKKLEGRKNELQKKQTEIQTLQQQMEAQRQTLNEDSLAALGKNIQVKTTELTRLQEDAEKEFGAMRNDILERIGRKMGPIVQKYAQEKAFSLLLDGSAQGSQLIFASTAIDVTDDIIKRYDGAYPVTGTVPATPAAK